MDTTAQTIARNVRRRLAARGWNPAHLATRGVARNTAYRVARGDGIPSSRVLAAVAEALGVSVAYLFRESENFESDTNRP